MRVERLLGIATKFDEIERRKEKKKGEKKGRRGRREIRDMRRVKGDLTKDSQCIKTISSDFNCHLFDFSEKRKGEKKKRKEMKKEIHQKSLGE